MSAVRRRGPTAGQMVRLVIATACTTPRLTTPPAPQAPTAAPPVASAVARPKWPLCLRPALGRVWDSLTMTLERTIPTPRGPTTVHSLAGGRFVHGWAPWNVVPGANRLLRLSDAVAGSLLVGAPPAAQGGMRHCGGVVAADDARYDGDEDMMAHLRFRADRGDVPSGPFGAAARSHRRRAGLFADYVGGKSIVAR